MRPIGAFHQEEDKAWTSNEKSVCLNSGKCFPAHLITSRCCCWKSTAGGIPRLDHPVQDRLIWLLLRGACLGELGCSLESWKIWKWLECLVVMKPHPTLWRPSLLSCVTCYVPLNLSQQVSQHGGLLFSIVQPTCCFVSVPLKTMRRYANRIQTPCENRWKGNCRL